MTGSQTKVDPARVALLCEALQIYLERCAQVRPVVELIVNLLSPGARVLVVGADWGYGFVSGLLAGQGFEVTLIDPLYRRPRRDGALPSVPPGVKVLPREFHPSDASRGDLILGYYATGALFVLHRVRRPMVLVPLGGAWLRSLRRAWTERRYARVPIGPKRADVALVSLDEAPVRSLRRVRRSGAARPQARRCRACRGEG